jgi:hypothetical protein
VDPEGLAADGGCVGGAPGTTQTCSLPSKGNCDRACYDSLQKREAPQSLSKPQQQATNYQMPDDKELRDACAVEAGKIVAFGGALVGLGQPILPTRGKLGAATPGTSPASVFFRKLFPQKISPVNVPTARNPNAMARTAGALMGRLTPYVGAFVAGAGATANGACVTAGMGAQSGIAQPMGF